MFHLSLYEVTPLLADHLAESLNQQIINPADPHFGSVISPPLGIPEPHATARLITLSLFQMLLDESPNDNLIERATWAADGLLKLLRPSGLMDLVTVNIDSAPDTGFMIQYLCGALELVGDLASPPLQQALVPVTERVEAVIRRTVPGMLTGGFHTPNHRWVMVAALAQAAALYPDLDATGEVTKGVNAYLAEGFDIDAEGTFIERSVGVYDAVNTRSLLLIAANWPDEQVRVTALDAVGRNLDFDFHLLHADGSAETGLSRRQDYGTRSVAIGLIPSLLLYNRLRPLPAAPAMACHLWRNYHGMGEHMTWILYALLRAGEPARERLPEALLPTDFARHYPLNGLWRVRRGLLSASAFEGVTRLFGLTYGEAELTSLKISHTYFGGPCGHFISDSLTVQPTGEALLRSAGLGRPRRPGYELPLGRAVPPERWTETMPERDLRLLPPIVGELTISEAKQGVKQNEASQAGLGKDEAVGFDLHFATVSGEREVATQIAFDFAPGGIWETSDSRFEPRPGQAIFLKRGAGEMRFNNDWIRIEPGAYSHGMWAMRDAEEAPNHVRVLLTFMTPVDCVIRIRCGRGWGG